MKNVKQIITILFYFCFIIIMLGGCQMKKQINVDLEMSDNDKETVEEIVKVDNNKGDLNKIVEKFIGITLEQAVEEGASYQDDSFDYKKGTVSFSYTGKSQEGLGPIILYDNQYEMAGEQYGTAINIIKHSHDETIIDWGLRKVLPDENLDNCKKEEALIHCNSYAELLGYDSDNAEVEVYALTLDKLQDNSYIQTYAPLAGIDNTDILSSDELRDIQSEYPWSKEYEAMYVVYKPHINGRLLDSVYCSLEMVYVPKYETIVYAFGQMPWVIKETMPSDSLISKEDAIAKTMLLNHIRDEKNMIVDNVVLVYSQNIVDLREENTLNLCWRVDYKMENLRQYSGTDAYKSTLINAVTGERCVMWPGLSD